MADGATAAMSELAKVVAASLCAHCGKELALHGDCGMWCGPDCLRAHAEKQRREHIRARAIAAERHFEECDGCEDCAGEGPDGRQFQ